jgi:hypothetical protein
MNDSFGREFQNRDLSCFSALPAYPELRWRRPNECDQPERRCYRSSQSYSLQDALVVLYAIGFVRYEKTMQ